MAGCWPSEASQRRIRRAVAASSGHVRAASARTTSAGGGASRAASRSISPARAAPRPQRTPPQSPSPPPVTVPSCPSWASWLVVVADAPTTGSLFPDKGCAERPSPSPKLGANSALCRRSCPHTNNAPSRAFASPVRPSVPPSPKAKTQATMARIATPGPTRFRSWPLQDRNRASRGSAHATRPQHPSRPTTLPSCPRLR